MFYSNLEDECWDIKNIIKHNLLDENDIERLEDIYGRV